MAELEIKENSGYKNVSLKTKIKRNGRQVVIENGKPAIAQKGLEPGESVVLEKSGFAEGKPVPGKFGENFLCRAIYNGEEVSFFLKPYEHQQWVECGGVGDKVLVEAEEAFFASTGAPYTKIKFSKAE